MRRKDYQHVMDASVKQLDTEAGVSANLFSGQSTES